MRTSSIQPEGSGIRTARVAKRGSLREHLYAFYRENPGAVMGRQQAADHFGVDLKTVDRLIGELRKEGAIVSVFGYALVPGVSVPPPKDELPPPPRKPVKRVRKPIAPLDVLASLPRIPNSVFQLAETL